MKKRILYLADRNVLIDQTMVNDFRPFGPAMAKLSTSARTIEKDDGTKVELITALGKHHSIDKSFEIYLSLYQAITGPEDAQKIFRDFSPTFFDLIVVDECHRGSAAEDSAWREILDYFSSATQIGMTATPKETKYVSNINYFGEPTYSYSRPPRRGHRGLSAHPGREGNHGCRHRRPALQPEGLRPEPRHRRADEARRPRHLLRRHRPRVPPSPSHRQRERRPREAEPEVRHEDP